jgi:hypothetical protein
MLNLLPTAKVDRNISCAERIAPPEVSRSLASAETPSAWRQVPAMIAAWFVVIE